MKTIHKFETELTEYDITRIIAEHLSRKSNLPITPDTVKLHCEPDSYGDLSGNMFKYRATISCMLIGEIK